MIFLLFGCGKPGGDDDGYYDRFVGTYKCVKIERRQHSLPFDSVVTIIPDADYELEFTRRAKVHMIKDGECEFKRKIEEFDYFFAEYIPDVYMSFNFFIDGEWTDFGVNDYYHPDPAVDTISALGFYPASLYDNSGDYYYTCDYVRVNN